MNTRLSKYWPHSLKLTLIFSVYVYTTRNSTAKAVASQ